MNDEQKARDLFARTEGGILTAKDFAKEGIHPSALQKLIEKGEIEKVSRGIYISKEAWYDELYLLQQRYPKGIFSHETALFYHQYTDRIPLQYTMTFPKGYHARSLEQSGIRVKYTSKENYQLGIMETTSTCGNPIRIYDLERTLCDLVKKKNTDVQILYPALREYASSSEKDLIKLDEYAKKLNTAAKVHETLRILVE